MVMLRNSSLIAAGFVILLVNGTGNPVYAQYSGASKKSFELEEVVVTARKRTESLSDIPEAITAFSGLDIDNVGITRIKDVADLTPNMILQPSYRLGVVNLSSRGIATPQQGDSPVVINFDGVQAPAQDFINQDLFDIERIEVLKGPQGALYGAGATAGAINIVTKQPSNEFDRVCESQDRKCECTSSGRRPVRSHCRRSTLFQVGRSSTRTGMGISKTLLPAIHLTSWMKL